MGFVYVWTRGTPDRCNLITEKKVRKLVSKDYHDPKQKLKDAKMAAEETGKPCVINTKKGSIDVIYRRGR